MNRFFQRRDSDSPVRVPGRVYALLIDGQGAEFALFDAVDADYFDEIYGAPEVWVETAFFRERGHWRAQVDEAPIFAIEVKVDGSATLLAWPWWPSEVLIDVLPQWWEIVLIPNVQGEAAVYDNIAGPPVRAKVFLRPLSQSSARALEKATDLGPLLASETDIAAALPASSIEEIFALDVGQGSANALVTGAGDVVAYVDLGAGVLADVRTWPASMRNVCLLHDPTIILTHWHYDHFHAANHYPAAQGMTWIAPLQTLGLGPQSAMANAIISSGTLLIWSGGTTLRTGSVELEHCTGPGSDQNRSGIAVWVWGPDGQDPILLPGDAGYKDIDELVKGRALFSLAASHHGGYAPGTPPSKPGPGAPRVAFSYGNGNGYGHPLTTSVNRLTAAGWTIGHPATGVDERRTEDRPGGTGGTGLGHIRLNWAGNTGLTFACTCGCTIDPTQ